MAASLADILASLDNGVRAVNNATVAINAGVTAISCVATSVSSLSGIFVEYTTGSWTPDLVYATSGDAVFTYTSQTGRYVKIGSYTSVTFSVAASALTFTTAAGILQINGLPFAAGGAMPSYQGSLDFNAILMSTTGYTQFVPEAIGGTSRIQIVANGQSPLARTFVTSTNVSSATVAALGGLVWRGTVPYMTA